MYKKTYVTSFYYFYFLSEKKCTTTSKNDDDDYDDLEDFSLLEDSTIDVNRPLNTTSASDWLNFKVTLWYVHSGPENLKQSRLKKLINSSKSISRYLF